MARLLKSWLIRRSKLDGGWNLTLVGRTDALIDGDVLKVDIALAAAPLEVVTDDDFTDLTDRCFDATWSVGASGVFDLFGAGSRRSTSTTATGSSVSTRGHGGGRSASTSTMPARSTPACSGVCRGLPAESGQLAVLGVGDDHCVRPDRHARAAALQHQLGRAVQHDVGQSDRLGVDQHPARRVREKRSGGRTDHDPGDFRGTALQAIQGALEAESGVISAPTTSPAPSISSVAIGRWRCSTTRAGDLLKVSDQQADFDTGAFSVAMGGLVYASPSESYRNHVDAAGLSGIVQTAADVPPPTRGRAVADLVAFRANGLGDNWALANAHLWLNLYKQTFAGRAPSSSMCRRTPRSRTSTAAGHATSAR